MKFTALQIAQLIKGRIEGNESIEVDKISTIETAEQGSITFLANSAYTKYIYTTNASIVIVNNDFVAKNPISSVLIKVENVYSSIAELLEFYNKQKNNKLGISKFAAISDNATIGEDCYISDFVSIGDNVKIGKNVKIYSNANIGDNVVIGDNTIIYPSVVIYSDCIIGNNCTFHSGVVIGSDGFGFAPHQNGYKKIPQTGNVIIEDYVEIGANTVIDRATIGSTLIYKGVKLDNLIQIAHNVEIGENTVMAAQSGIAGSTKIGKNCMIGGQVGITGHLTIADNVMIAAQSGIDFNVTLPGQKLMGSPAFDAMTYKKQYVTFRKLNEKLNEIKKMIK